jgi:RNA polymerase sigma-32 factor
LFLIDTIESDEDIETTIANREDACIISQAPAQFGSDLDHKAAFVLDHRIMAEEPLTLQEIGDVFNLSRERIRQIEVRVIDQLRKRFVWGIQTGPRKTRTRAF